VSNSEQQQAQSSFSEIVSGESGQAQGRAIERVEQKQEQATSKKAQKALIQVHAYHM
jgi:hypothetical protein